MPGKHTRKGSRDLQYTVFRKIIHPEFFGIQSRELVEEEYYRAEIWIIDNGHVVTVRTDRHALVEVVAEKTSDAPRRGVIKKAPIRERGLNKIQLPESDGISYSSEYTLDRLPTETYREQHDTAILAAHDRRLMHTFPPAEPDALSPFTLIDFHVERGALQVSAVHAYPDELTLITTRSTFEI